MVCTTAEPPCVVWRMEDWRGTHGVWSVNYGMEKFATTIFLRQTGKFAGQVNAPEAANGPPHGAPFSECAYSQNPAFLWPAPARWFGNKTAAMSASEAPADSASKARK